VLRKDFQGLEANAGYGQSTEGVGKTTNAGFAYGFGNLDQQGFNLMGGIELSRRDPVWHRELRDLGNLDEQNRYLNLTGATSRLTPDSSASPWANYYRVPASLAGTTRINNITVQNNDLSGVNYLGTLPGCPGENTVGQGVPNRPAGFTATQASLPTGMCRFNLDQGLQAISAQDRISGSLRASFALNRDLIAYADLMLGRTESTESANPRTMTTTLASQSAPFVVSTPRLDRTIARQGGIVLPVGHPDNPTNGTANAQPVQLIYRFHDLPAADIVTQTASRLALGVQGLVGVFGSEWDLDAALLYSRMDNERVQTNRLRSSLLNPSIASGTYRFNGQVNTPQAIASVASDAVNEGDSSILSIDARASRALFKMGGGDAMLALGFDARREQFNAGADEAYRNGDYIGLVANVAEGKRNAYALFAELGMPISKSVELQAALRQEKYSDFGNSTTGKLGGKWVLLPSTLMLRGTAATGFRAPAISQIGNASAVSFNNFQERRVFDPIRCNATDPANPVSRADPPDLRDCNILNFTAGVPVVNRPGNMATIISANPNLKPEKSKSFTAGLVFSPTRNLDIGLDWWMFDRRDEIRVQRTIDILDNAFAGGSQAAQVVRDTNPATWLPGVPDSGPILMIIRQYDNYNTTKTSGLDYDLNARMPTNEWGRFSLRISGTYTRKYEVQVLDNTPPQDQLGTTTSEVPRTKASAQLSWERGPWNQWVRLNHTDKLARIGTTDPCLASSSAANVQRKTFGSCFVGLESTWDVGLSYSGFKNLTLSANVLNVFNDYRRSTDVPSSFTFWDAGTAAMVGRRFNLSVSYRME
jgi:iron complex outermembrane recepter protein